MPYAAGVVGDCITAIGYTALTENFVSSFTYTNYATATRKCVFLSKELCCEVNPLFPLELCEAGHFAVDYDWLFYMQLHWRQWRRDPKEFLGDRYRFSLFTLLCYDEHSFTSSHEICMAYGSV